MSKNPSLKSLRLIKKPSINRKEKKSYIAVDNNESDSDEEEYCVVRISPILKNVDHKLLEDDYFSIIDWIQKRYLVSKKLLNIAKISSLK